MDKPNNIDPVQWALWNQRQDRTLAAISGLPAPEYGPLVIEPPDTFTALQRAVSRAVDILQAGGERENRSATDLLTAMARLEAEAGL